MCGGSSIIAILILLSLIPHNFEDDLTQCRLSKFYQSVVEKVARNLEPNRQTHDEHTAGLESKIADDRRMTINNDSQFPSIPEPDPFSNR